MSIAAALGRRFPGALCSALLSARAAVAARYASSQHGAKEHQYRQTLEWMGAAKNPVPFEYSQYSREFVVRIPGKADIVGSADTPFLGDPALHNPEDLLLAAVASCHMLTYLALCARSRIPVLAYTDAPVGTMHHTGVTFQFRDVVLHPVVTVPAGVDEKTANALHEKAHHLCFIAQSVNFPIRHVAEIRFRELA